MDLRSSNSASNSVPFAKRSANCLHNMARGSDFVYNRVAHSVHESCSVECLLVDYFCQVVGHLALVRPVAHILLDFLLHGYRLVVRPAMTPTLQRPHGGGVRWSRDRCRREVITRVTKVELFPPPCSACRHSMMSSIRASSGLNERSGRNMDKIVLGPWIDPARNGA